MQIDRRKLIVAASLAGLGNVMRANGEESGEHLYRTESPGAILAATRVLMAEDTVGTLITVDATGQPRARSIRVSVPDSDLTLWMGTRKGSRKLEQIAANHRATVHFADDAQNSYLSLMGEARVVSDAGTIAIKNPFQGEALRRYFPAFPNNFVLLSFKPHTLEIVAKGLPTRSDTWQPQGLAV